MPWRHLELTSIAQLMSRPLYKTVWSLLRNCMIQWNIMYSYLLTMVILFVTSNPQSLFSSTVYPKKYAHGFCFAVVIHWLIFPYPSGLFHWHCGNLTIAPVPAKQPWWIWINTSCEFIMNDCITTTKQSTTNPCAYFLGYTVCVLCNTSILLDCWVHGMDITAVKSPCYNTWQGPSVVKWGACRCLFKCFREVVNLRGLNWYRYT